MISFNNYISEKLHLNKDTKIKETFIDFDKLIKFLQENIFSAINTINTDNLNEFKSVLNDFNKFKLYTTEMNKQIWGTVKDLNFIKYLDLDDIKDLKLDIDKSYYLGGGIYWWKNTSESTFAITIMSSGFNDFDHAYDPIIIATSC
jgi:hypothetical protein